MALSSDPFDSTELQYMIPEVWTPMVLEELFAKTVFANFCTDLSGYAANGGDIFHVPDVYTNAFSVQTQSTQGAEITTDAPAQSEVQLAVNTHSYIALLIGDKDARQIASQYSFNEIYTRKAGSTLADALEDALAALWSGLSTNSVGDTATVLTDLEVRQAIEKLASANYDLREAAFFVHPYVLWTQLLAIQKYYDVSQRGMIGTGSSTLEGNFGPMDASRGLAMSLYGVPVFQTSNVVSGLLTYRNLLLHKSAFAFALQTPGGSKVRIQTDYLVQNIATLTVLDMIYGVIELRDAAGVVLNANTTSTAS